MNLLSWTHYLTAFVEAVDTGVDRSLVGVSVCTMKLVIKKVIRNKRNETKNCKISGTLKIGILGMFLI